MALDAFQQAAVDCNDAHIQIIGHPGTGKTMVMANRIARLLREGTPPEAVCALTFSNSARAALRERVAALVGDSDAARAVEINTFHSFCANLISSFPADVGLTSDWRMVDHLDMYNLLADPTLALPTRRRARFPDGFSPGERRRFRERLAPDRSYDFDTAMELGCRIARGRDLGVHHLLIDEFQDGQAMQWQLVRAMAAVNPALRVCVVGDANQEIFAFRSDHLRDAFATMRSTFPDTTVLDLRMNYRSSPEIISTFQQIPPQSAAHRPDLIATRPHGREPELAVFASPQREAAALADLAAQLATTYKPGEIAVLVRYNRHILQLRRELDARGIPTANALNVRALATLALPNLAISLLKWANDPCDLYLSQLLYSKHHKFISDGEYKRLCSDAPSLLGALAQSQYATHPFLVDTLPRIRESLLRCDSVADLARQTAATVESWREIAGGRRTKLYAPAGWTEFKRLLAGVELAPELLDPAGGDGSEPAQPGGVLKALLRHLFQHGDEVEGNRVQVRTIHSAKSREWPCVIVAGRIQNAAEFFPTSADDERRLLYVAASRARERLYFTSASAVGSSGFLRFLNPAPRPLMQPADAAALYPKQYLRILAQSALRRPLII